MIQEFARTLRTLLRTEIENYKEDLSNGQPRDFEEYRRLCGLIQGLRIAEQHVSDLAKRAETDDD